MKVLVVTSPRHAVFINTIDSSIPPLSQGIDSIPLRLASVIEKEYETRFYPFSYTQYNYYTLNEEEINKIFSEDFVDVLVISSDYFISNRTTASFDSSLQIAKLFKTVYPESKVICCGKHCIVSPRDFFRDKKVIDLIFTSEAENRINEVINLLSQNEFEKLQQIPNLLFINENQQIIETEKSISVVDINQLPSPAYHMLVKYKDILKKKEELYSNKIPLTLRTSYGCIYKCPFCAGIPFWGNYRFLSKNSFERDLKEMQDSLNDEFELCFFDDELFTLKKEHVEDIALVMKSLDMKIYGVLTHTSLFTKEIAELLSTFSEEVIFGGENFYDEILKNINKNQTLSSLIDKCRLAREYGLKTRVEFICGLPYETWESVLINLKTICYLLRSKTIDIISPYILVPHPGTEYYENASKYGIHIINKDFSEYIEEGGYPVFETDFLTSHQIYFYYLQLQEIKRVCEKVPYELHQSMGEFSFELFKKGFERMI